MPDDRAERHGIQHGRALDIGIEADDGQHERRNQRGRENSFADVDDHDEQREHLALRAQRVRAAGIAAADLADVHAPEMPHQQAAERPTEQVRERELQAELQHAERTLGA